MKVDESGWKWMNVDDCGWMWMKLDEIGWKWMKVDDDNISWTLQYDIMDITALEICSLQHIICISSDILFLVFDRVLTNILSEGSATQIIKYFTFHINSQISKKNNVAIVK